MAKYTRSEFLRTVGATAAATGLGLAGSRARAQAGGTIDATRPDLVLVNGRVLTMDDDLPRAEAFAVKAGRFVAIGTNDDIRNLVRPETEIIDAAGTTVTPGFIDAHSHPASGGVRELVSVNLDLRSIGAIQDAIRKRAAETPPGEWIQGFKYDDTKVREGRQLTRKDLDEAAPDHPVVVTHRGGHVSWYNTKAFERVGVTAQDPRSAGRHDLSRERRAHRKSRRARQRAVRKAPFRPEAPARRGRRA